MTGWRWMDGGAWDRAAGDLAQNMFIVAMESDAALALWIVRKNWMPIWRYMENRDLLSGLPAAVDTIAPDGAFTFTQMSAK